MNLFAFRNDGVRCNGCNWEVTYLFVLSRNQQEARWLLKKGFAGLCGTCMSEMLALEKYEIELPEKVRKEFKKKGR